MTIKIGSKIEKLNPGDSYKLMDGGDVEGFDAVFKSARIDKGDVILTRNDDSELNIGKLDDLSQLKDGQVPVMGPDGRLIYSGVTVTDDGLVKIPSNTLGFGDPMELGSATGFAIIHNNVTELSYMLLDYSVSDKAASGRPTQFYIEKPALSSEPVAGADITDNPAMFSQTTPATGASFKLILNVNEAMKNVKIQIIDGKTKIPFKHLPSRKAWENDALPGMDFRAGKNTLNFFSNEPNDPANGMFNIGVTPITLAANWDVDYIIKADNINLKGDADGHPWLRSLFGRARFRGVAWQDELASAASGNAVVSVGIDDDGKLLITHGDGSKHLITLPAGAPSTALATRVTAVEQTLAAAGTDIVKLKQDYGVVDTKLTELEGVYTYSGDDAPTFPAEAKSAYFVNLHGSVIREVTFDAPDPVGGNVPGATLYATNGNSAADTVISAPTGFTINNAAKYTIPAETFSIFVLNGTNWVLVHSNSLSTQSMTLTAEQVARATDNGTAPDSGSIKGLADGWWFIPSTNSNVTGRPSGSTGDVTILRQKLTAGNKTNFVVILAFGNDANDKPAMWAQYRNGGKWTSWFQVNQSADLTALTADVAALQAGEPGQLARLNRLETAIGQIYSPTKLAFDDAVNALIDAKIKSSQGDAPALPTGVPKIYAEYNTAFPTAIGVGGQVSSTSGIITLNRADSTTKRIFILVPNDANQAEDVTGFSVDGGLKALWDARDINIDGKKYRAFYTPGGYTEQTNRVRVYFGNQG